MLLKKTCLFDLYLQGPRLKPIAFGLRSCNETEHSFHSFTGNSACGRWSIIQYRKFLWGCHFYWLCNCSAIKEILEYNGNIPLICHWAQELLSSQFSVIHRSHRMMANMDALTRRFDPLITSHHRIAHILHIRDIKDRPLVY